jgi:hypothetical protein
LSHRFDTVSGARPSWSWRPRLRLQCSSVRTGQPPTSSRGGGNTMATMRYAMVKKFVLDFFHALQYDGSPRGGTSNLKKGTCTVKHSTVHCGSPQDETGCMLVPVRLANKTLHLLSYQARSAVDHTQPAIHRGMYVEGSSLSVSPQHALTSTSRSYCWRQRRRHHQQLKLLRTREEAPLSFFKGMLCAIEAEQSKSSNI